ncbi:MAG: hypothetical protein AAFO57_05935 [Pseudomonadota bacterium]
MREKPVHPRHARRLRQAVQFGFKLMDRFEAQLARQDRARALADAAGDVVPIHDQIAAIFAHPAHDYMRVRMIGVVMVRGDPVEARAVVGFHLAHQLANKGLEIAKMLAVLRRDDEAEMVVILAPAGEKLAALNTLLLTVVELTPSPVLTGAVAAQIRKVCALQGEALAGNANDPRFHHDAAAAASMAPAR